MTLHLFRSLIQSKKRKKDHNLNEVQILVGTDKLSSIRNSLAIYCDLVPAWISITTSRLFLRRLLISGRKKNLNLHFRPKERPKRPLMFSPVQMPFLLSTYLPT